MAPPPAAAGGGGVWSKSSRDVLPPARWRELRYSGKDADGHPIERLAQDFHARVVQHEVDHFDGILYPRRIRDLSMFGFTDVLFPGEGLSDD